MTSPYDAGTVHLQRWLPCKNVGSTIIPPFGACQLESVEFSDDGRQIYHVKMPTSKAQTNIGFNCWTAIQPGKHGTFTRDFPCFAAYSSGTPKVGDAWGVDKNSSYLAKDISGFRIFGEPKNNRVMVTHDVLRAGITLYQSSSTVIPEGAWILVSMDTEAQSYGQNLDGTDMLKFDGGGIKNNTNNDIYVSASWTLSANRTELGGRQTFVNSALYLDGAQISGTLGGSSTSTVTVDQPNSSGGTVIIRMHKDSVITVRAKGDSNGGDYDPHSTISGGSNLTAIIV